MIACVLGLALTLGLASTAGAHGVADTGSSSQPSAAAAKAGSKLKLRNCWMTVMFVPRPQEVLESALPWQVDLSRSFYGLSESLLTSWSLSCDKAKAMRKKIGKPIMSFAAAPFGVVDEQGVPLASNFAHAVVAVDTNKRKLSKLLRRGGFPAKTGKLRYEHSDPGAVPFTASLDVPDKYQLGVEASTLDVVHNHNDTFEYQPPKGKRARMQLEVRNAVDRFCFVAGGDCTAALSTPGGSPLGEAFGGPSAGVFLGLDHALLPKVKLILTRD
ncbi:MAG TPA: hypothetical protein VK920_06270 [Solirubrobacterales bacterium]|nr:hypothetical protein [Solirubrobacterales bacterium]